jgi:hypothetical protein
MKGNKWAIQYPFLVWVLTILLTPIFMWPFTGFIETFENAEIFGLIEIIALSWIMGGLFSFPSFVFFIVVNHLLDRLTINMLTKKIIFGLVGIGCILITFIVLGISLETFLTLSYSFMFFILSLAIKRV